jgi:hypothetical protein
VNSTNSVAAVEQAARRYFEALTEPETDTSRYSTGGLAELNRLNAATPFGTATSDVTIERLVVTRVDGEMAEGELVAQQHLVIEGQYGRQEVHARFSGPLRMRRVAGEWRVADYVMDGDSLTDSFFPLEPSTNGALGVAVRPRGLFRNRNTLVLYLEVENQTAHTVDLSWASFKSCFAPLSRTEVLPGEMVVVRTGWRKRLAPWNRKLRIFLHARARSAPERYTFETVAHLGSGQAPVRRHRWMPVSLWLTRFVRRAAVRIPFFAVVLGLAVAFRNYHGIVAAAGFLGAALLSDEILVKLDRRWWKPGVILRIAFDSLGVVAIVAAVVLS